eukprot:GFUD01004673.1.p1 GENE.GFUD01004673.1~~GFUD01004673.1.p1  ORF type:complete len:309 (+),score=82.64 GFUD01004673.1:50-976(+)
MESTLKERESEEEWKVVRVEQKGVPFNVPEGFEIVEMDESNFLQYLPKVQHLLRPDMQQGMEGGTIKFARKIGTSGNEDEKPKTKQENPLGDLLGMMGGLMTAFGMSQEDAAVMKNQGDQLFVGMESVLKTEATETVDSVIVSYEIPTVNGKAIYEWKNMDNDWSLVPSNALSATPPIWFQELMVYVGRGVLSHGQLHIGKVHNGKRYVVAEWCGEERTIFDDKYEVLCVDPDATVSWVDCEEFVHGEVPDGAVGWSNDGEDQYVGRGTIENQIIPGKIVPKDGCMYVPYGGNAQKLTKYEVLIIKGK